MGTPSINEPNPEIAITFGPHPGCIPLGGMFVQRFVRSLLMGCLLAPSARVSAQQSATSLTSVALGMRVRVTAPSVRRERIVGRIDSLDAGSVVLDTTRSGTRFGFGGGPVLVDRLRFASLQTTAVQRIEVSGGRTVRRTTLLGAVIGAAGGALLWGFAGLPEVNPGFSDFTRNAPKGAAIGLVLGGVVGFALGGERWLPAVLPR